jgi:hypothetical protein
LNENDRNSLAGRDRFSEDEQASWPRSRGALWTLVVLGALVALGGLWFVVLGHAPLGGSGPGVSRALPSTSGRSDITSQTALLTTSDVEAVLGRIDYTESNESSVTVYANTVRRVIAGIDVVAFARNTLQATPTIWWVEPGDGGARVVGGAEKNALVAEALAAYVKRRGAVGDADTLGDVLGVKLFPPTRDDRNRPDSGIEVIGQGLAPLGLMFGAHDVGSQWAWHVEKVIVTGPESADVTYSASVAPGASFKFADPSARYVKHLTFGRATDGGWRLAGWSNYDQIRSQFRANILPPGTAPQLDEWWGAL